MNDNTNNHQEWNGLIEMLNRNRTHQKMNVIDKLLTKQSTWALVAAGSILCVTWYLSTNQIELGAFSMFVTIMALLIGLTKKER